MLKYSSIDQSVREEDRLVLPESKEDIIWIHFKPENKEKFDLFLESLDIHPLAKEELAKFDDIPKVNVYKNVAVMTLFAIQDDFTEAKITILAGENFVITKEGEKIGLLEQLMPDLLQNPEHMKSVGLILFHIFNKVTMVDLRMIDRIADSIQKLEREVFDQPFDNGIARKVYRWKRTLHHLRNGIEAQGNMMETIAGSEFPFINENAGFYFQSLNNSFTRVINGIDGFRANLDSIFNLQMTLKADHSNAIMKTLTLFSVIFIPMTFIAGLYGMNFLNMPELKWRYGYLFALILMAGIGTSIAFYFKSKGWWGRKKL
ncbi:magnesium transporter CorA family protein [Falsibacillus pallidus]|uniref:Magnesium transporter n=1 Tax=Falsibacillus pallidus TaxID=493781 RepID=A0A370GSB1_9BACI|nr:magnesium transporter CorA family protein [Falsibacillus pallidus]RDI45394.1 magnesium transporter [Falsibacillus pallidus]